MITAGCRWADMPISTAQNPLHICGFGNRQKGIWKKILSRLIKSVRKQASKQASKQGLTCKNFNWFIINCCQKRGNEAGYDGFRKIPGTRIHVAADKAGLPISAGTSPANEHDSAKFIDVLEDISELTDDSLGRAIASAYADRGYDAKCIRDCLSCHGIDCRIPYKRNPKKIAQNRNQMHHGKTRFVAERFLAWLKCGFHRTAARCEKSCDNYLGFAYLASIMMYWRVLG